MNNSTKANKKLDEILAIYNQQIIANQKYEQSIF